MAGQQGADLPEPKERFLQESARERERMDIGLRRRGREPGLAGQWLEAAQLVGE